MANKKQRSQEPTFMALNCAECNEAMQVMLGFQADGFIRLAARCMGCEDDPEFLEFHDTILWRHTIALHEGQWVAITDEKGQRVHIQSSHGELQFYNDHRGGNRPNDGLAVPELDGSWRVDRQS